MPSHSVSGCWRLLFLGHEYIACPPVYAGGNQVILYWRRIKEELDVSAAHASRNHVC